MPMNESTNGFSGLCQTPKCGNEPFAVGLCRQCITHQSQVRLKAIGVDKRSLLNSVHALQLEEESLFQTLRIVGDMRPAKRKPRACVYCKALTMDLLNDRPQCKDKHTRKLGIDMLMGNV